MFKQLTTNKTNKQKMFEQGFCVWEGCVFKSLLLFADPGSSSFDIVMNKMQRIKRILFILMYKHRTI